MQRQFIHLPIAPAIHSLQIHEELSKVERQQMIVSYDAYQTIANKPNMRTPTVMKHKLYRFLDYCLSLHQQQKVMSTVKTGTSLFHAFKPTMNGTKQYDMTWLYGILKT